MGFTINSKLMMRGAKLEISPPSSGTEHQTTADVKMKKKMQMPGSTWSGQLAELEQLECLHSEIPPAAP